MKRAFFARPLAAFAALTLLLALAVPVSAQQATLTLAKTTFAPGELITCYFTTTTDLPPNAWIGLIPSSIPHGDEAVNDQHDQWYEYLQSRTDGYVQVTAPMNEGSWDLRLNYSDSNGPELASVTFMVASGPATGQSSLSLGQTVFAPGAPVTVHFTADPSLPSDAWVGLIPSATPHGDEATNDTADVAYEYVSGRASGDMVFTAPTTPGSYDLRLNYSDQGGAELASVTFTVDAGPSTANSLRLDMDQYMPGASVTVHFIADPSLPSDAWVGLIPSATPHGDEATNDTADVAYEYVSGRASGDMVFTAPSTPGSYDLRLNYSDGGGAELASVTFTVINQGATNSLTLLSSTYAPGEKVTVNFTADPSLPSNAWVGLIPSATPHGSEATNDSADIAYEYVGGRAAGTMDFTAPSTPGSWDLRLNYSDNGGDELASVTFIVQ